jgi:hypothetical protein
MKKSIPLLLAGLLAGTAATDAKSLLYDSFNYDTGVDANLIGKVNTNNGNTWTEIGSSTADATIDTTGKLSYFTLETNPRRVQLPSFSGSTKDAGLNFSGGSTDLYYSFLLRLDNVNTMGTGFQGLTRLVNVGGSINGLGVSVRTNSGNADTYDLGIHKRAGTPDTTSALQGLAEGTTYFVVVRYVTNPGTGDDAMEIWLNPAVGSLGIASPPTATFSSTSGNDTAVAWNQFQLTPPNQTSGVFDELRVGTSWEDVTPAPLLLYDGFSYTNASTLIGNTNANGNAWAEAATGTNEATINEPDQVTYGPLRTSAGRVQLPSFSSSTRDASLAFTNNVGSAAIYYSFILRLDSVGESMSTTFQAVTRLNNGGTNGPAVFIRKNGSNYDLGIHKRANSGAVATDTAIQNLATGSTNRIFVVVSYEPVAGDSNDVMNIWLNPANGDLGATTAPAATFSSIAGSDVTTAWNTFALFPPNQVSGYFDELRVGTSWSHVTQATTSTNLESDSNPSNSGDTVTFTATVSSGGATPTGTVRFKVDAVTVAESDLVAGVATYSTNSLAPGTRVIRAEYLGTNGHNSSAFINYNQEVTGGNYATWASANNVTGGVNGDSDNDGIRNGVEYALQTNLSGSDGSVGSFVGNLLTFTKRQDAIDNGDVTYIIETSPDLTTWTPQVTQNPGNTDGTISYSLPTGQGKLFGRLLVVIAP